MRVAEFEVTEKNELPICISYQFKDSEKIVTKELFNVGSNFPSTKNITFDNKVGNLNLSIHYAEGTKLPQGVPNEIAKYEISEGKKGEKTEKTSFTMKVTNNIHNVPCLDEVEFCQMWTEQEQYEVKQKPVVEEKKVDATPAGFMPGVEAAPTVPEPPKVPEKVFAMRDKHKKTFTQLKYTSKSSGLGAKTTTEFTSLEQKFVDGDFDILETKASRNDLEAYSYEMRGNLEGSMAKYLEEGVKKEFIAEINEVVEWIYGDGEFAAKEVCKAKLDKFKAIGDPVKNRHFYYSELDVYYTQYEACEEHIQKRTLELTHLTDESKSMLGAKNQIAQSFIEKVKTDRKAKELYQDPAYTLDLIITTLTTVKKETEAIFNLPIPPPKPVEEDQPMDEMPNLDDQNNTPTFEKETNEEMKNEDA